MIASPASTKTVLVGLEVCARPGQEGHAIWPQTVDGVVSLTMGQASYLLEGIDWRNPRQTWRPLAAG
jgi:transposase